METILEEEGEDSMETNSKITDDYSAEVIQQYIKEQRKVQKNSRTVQMKRQKPPKWICTVKDCKWGGRDMEEMMDHLKKQHPNENGSQFKLKTNLINCFKYSQTRTGSLKTIKNEVKVKKEVEQLELKLKDL
uniref:C2H2-type domain-containing protein n=1 Tax=Caenorhabditis tropicalis TaxID=1561998 RepID=A0A1I7UJZ8_9PELO